MFLRARDYFRQKNHDSESVIIFLMRAIATDNISLIGIGVQAGM